LLDKQARILEEVTTLLRDIFAREDLAVTPATTATDVPGWDSIKQIEIIVAAEEKYRIRMKAREVDGLRSVGDLVALIDEKSSS
jgi:acyl carrier protein